MVPRDPMLLRVGSYVALEVDVVSLLDVVSVQRGAQRHRQHRAILLVERRNVLIAEYIVDNREAKVYSGTLMIQGGTATDTLEINNP